MTKLTLDVILNNPYTSFLTPYYKFNLIKSDPNDNKFLNYAVIANAKFIMTEDRHFDVLKECPFPKIEVIGRTNNHNLRQSIPSCRYRMTMYHVFAIAE